MTNLNGVMIPSTIVSKNGTIFNLTLSASNVPNDNVSIAPAKNDAIAPDIFPVDAYSVNASSIPPKKPPTIAPMIPPLSKPLIIFLINGVPAAAAPAPAAPKDDA